MCSSFLPVLSIFCIHVQGKGHSKHATNVQYGQLLNLESWCSQKLVNRKQYQYALCGIVAHEGDNASSGLYTGTFSYGQNLWKQFRAGSCTNIYDRQALEQQQQVYMLVYRLTPVR